MTCKRPRRIAALILALFSATACGGGDDTGGQVVPKIIEITVAKPVSLSHRAGKVKFEGTLVASDPAVTDLAVELKVKSNVVGSGPGPNFSIEVDTTALDAKGKPIFKDGKVCVSISATGSDNANGKVNHCLLVDNTDPVIEVASPVADKTYIGKMQITGSVNDKYLKDLKVLIDGVQKVGYCDTKKDSDGDGTPDCTLESCAEKFDSCISTKAFSFALDRGNEASKDVTVTIEAVDETDHVSKLDVPVRVLRPPSFDTSTTYNDQSLEPINDILVSDFDRDGIQDVLLATGEGVFLKRGHRESPTKAVGDGTLEAPILVSPVIVTRMALGDIDGDTKKINDVVGIGVDKEGVGQVHVFLTKAGGIRLTESVAIGGTPLSVALGDIDLNGVPDVVVGGQQDDTALQILAARGPDELYCPSKEDPKRLCKSIESADALAGSQILTEPYQRPLAGGITKLVIDDFFIDSETPYPDIAVGRSSSASLSMCFNKKGNVMACIDVPKTGYVADMPDVSLMIPTDWNQDGKMDLVIGSRGAGLLRWIASNGDGTFSFDPKSYRTLFLKSMSSVTVGPVGPGGKDYLMVAGQGRTVTFIPVLPDDRSHIDKCFRSWILGGSIETLRYGDLNNDGSVELIGIDSKPWGVAISMATGDGNYHAATVHRICGLNSGTFFFSFLQVSKFLLGDVSADGKPDLLLMSNSETSTITAKAGSCKTDGTPAEPIPRATHYIHLYANAGEALEEAARAGEWGPYNSAAEQTASGTKVDAKATCGGEFPPITGLKLGEFNGSPPMDMVLTREQDYSAGQPPAPEALCPFNERNEVSNLFGEENANDENGGGPACVNFKDTDEDKSLALSSSKGGAPLLRTSLVTFVNADPSAPFGLKTSNRPDNPASVRAHFQMAGGKRPQGLVVGRFDGDTIDDVATLMAAEGAPTQDNYLAPRVRIFRGLAGRLKPILFFKNGTKEGDKIANENPATPKEVVGINDLSTWAQLSDEGNVEKIIPVSYHTTGDKTFSMRGERYCKDGETSLFFVTKIGDDVKLAVVRAQGNLKFSPVTAYNGGTTLMSAFALVDADGDKCTDAVVVVDKHLAYSRGTTSWYESWKYFLPVDFDAVPSIELLDVNNDKHKDLLLVDGTSSSLRFFLNDGDGNFVAHEESVPVLKGASVSALGDIDGDGCGDLAVQGTYGVAVIRSKACDK